MLAVTPDLHVLRDPTRGGLATSLNEIAAASDVGVVLDERALPVPEVVANACAFLGLDPLYVANEGKLVAFVPPRARRRGARRRCARTRSAPSAAVIGECVEDHPGMVVATHRLRRHAGRRPADRRAAAADLLT